MEGNAYSARRSNREFLCLERFTTGEEGGPRNVRYEVCIGEVSGYVGSRLTRPKASYHFLILLHFRLCPSVFSYTFKLS